jgi:chloramphenicol-sensitive protein RarD
MSQSKSKRTGVLYGLAAYGWWGLVVVYFKWVRHVPPLELLAHRIVWSVLLLAGLLAYRQRFTEVVRAVRNPRVLRILLATTVLVGCNWFTFLWAVLHDRVVEASLGYFINPLVNVLLGFVFLRERLRPAQWLSVGLACAGVVAMTLQFDSPPLIALILAFSFGLYGLLRKIVGVESMVGLATETLLLLPVAGGYLLWLGIRGDLVFAHLDRSTDLLLVAAGVVTALPLLWFAHAARRLNLATVGFLQYLAPSLQLLIGVTVYHEAFTPQHAVSFGLIWLGLLIYSVEAARRLRGYRTLPS